MKKVLKLIYKMNPEFFDKIVLDQYITISENYFVDKNGKSIKAGNNIIHKSGKILKMKSTEHNFPLVIDEFLLPHRVSVRVINELYEFTKQQ